MSPSEPMPIIRHALGKFTFCTFKLQSYGVHHEHIDPQSEPSCVSCVSGIPGVQRVGLGSRRKSQTDRGRRDAAGDDFRIRDRHNYGTVAHIHVGAPGQSGPPIITLSKGGDGAWSVPAGSILTDEQYASFKAGNLYVNVHSAEHKPGEIRDQLKP
jgi:hypothetical protein